MKKLLLLMITISSPLFAADSDAAMSAQILDSAHVDWSAVQRSFGGKIDDDNASIAGTEFSTVGELDSVQQDMLDNLHIQIRTAKQSKDKELTKKLKKQLENLKKKIKENFPEESTTPKAPTSLLGRLELQLDDTPNTLEAIQKLHDKWTNEGRKLQKAKSSLSARKQQKFPEEEQLAAYRTMVKRTLATLLLLKQQAGQDRKADQVATSAADRAMVECIKKEAADAERAKEATDLEKAQTKLANLKAGIETEFQQVQSVKQTLLEELPKSDGTLKTLKAGMKKAQISINLARISIKESMRITEEVEKVKIELSKTFKDDPVRIEELTQQLPTITIDDLKKSQEKIDKVWNAISQHNLSKIQAHGIQTYDAQKGGIAEAIVAAGANSHIQIVDAQKRREEARKTLDELDAVHRDKDTFIKEIRDLSSLGKKVVIDVSFCPVHGFDLPRKCTIAKAPLSRLEATNELTTHELIDLLKLKALDTKDPATHEYQTKPLKSLAHIVTTIDKLGITGELRITLLEQARNITSTGWEHF
jgi:DNA repair exonuclease SbcCD ATPase subunit